MANPSRLEKIQITGNTNSGTATKVNVQEANGEVNTQTINTGFNKNIGLGGSDVVGANTLLNQYATTPSDWTAQSYVLNSVVFYGGKQWISKTTTVAGDVPSVSSKWEEITFEALANKTTTVDQTIIDGSTNSVSSNAVFDGLALKSNIGHTHVASQITDLSKASVGLGNVDNTSDLSKPLSTATQTALNGKENSFTKNTAFNKNFGITAGTVVEGGTLGSNAYNSTAYLPLTGGTLSGYLNLNDGIPLVLGDESTSRLRFITSNGVNYIQSGAGSGYGTRADLVITGNYGGNETVRFKDNGRVLINKTNDDLTNQLQVAGTISASPATTANQVVVKSQLDAVAGVSGTYTPSLTNVVNVSGLSLTSLATYSKIGKIVTLTISANFGSGGTSDTICTFDVSLPSSKNAGGNQYIGTGSVLTGTNDIMPLFAALQTSSTVRCAFKHTSNASGKININIQYQEN